MDGVDFAEVYANSQPILIDGDLPARYISAEDLITNKLASGRLQDLADVEAFAGPSPPRKAQSPETLLSAVALLQSAADCASTA